MGFDLPIGNDVIGREKDDYLLVAVTVEIKPEVAAMRGIPS